MNRELNDSLFELYEQGGLALYLEGARGLKRDVIIDPAEGSGSSAEGVLSRETS